jgi:hypothetical protein
MTSVLIAGPAVAAVDDGLVRHPAASPDQASPALACAALQHKVADLGLAQFKRLDQLPAALLEHAVLRTVEGCPVREVIVQGQVYYTQPSVPERQPVGPPR